MYSSVVLSVFRPMQPSLHNFRMVLPPKRKPVSSKQPTLIPPVFGSTDLLSICGFAYLTTFLSVESSVWYIHTPAFIILISDWSAITCWYTHTWAYPPDHLASIVLFQPLLEISGFVGISHINLKELFSLLTVRKLKLREAEQFAQHHSVGIWNSDMGWPDFDTSTAWLVSWLSFRDWELAWPTLNVWS